MISNWNRDQNALEFSYVCVQNGRRNQIPIPRDETSQISLHSSHLILRGLTSSRKLLAIYLQEFKLLPFEHPNQATKQEMKVKVVNTPDWTGHRQLLSFQSGSLFVLKQAVSTNLELFLFSHR